MTRSILRHRFGLTDQQINQLRCESLARAIELHAGGLIRVNYYEPLASDDIEPFFFGSLDPLPDEIEIVVPADEDDVIGVIGYRLATVGGRLIDAAQSIASMRDRS